MPPLCEGQSQKHRGRGLASSVLPHALLIVLQALALGGGFGGHEGGACMIGEQCLKETPPQSSLTPAEKLWSGEAQL